MTLCHLWQFPRCGDVKSWQYIIIQIYHDPGCKILNHINFHQKTAFFDQRILKKYHFYPYFCIFFVLNWRKWRKWRIYFCMWKKFYKKSKEQNGKTKKYLYMIYMVCLLRHLRHSRCGNMEQKKILYIYVYIYKFAKTRILWTWYRSMHTMYFYWFFIIVYFLY